MKFKLFFTLAVSIIGVHGFSQKANSQTKQLQKIYAKYDKNLKKRHKLDEKAGIPPNQYFEQDYKNTMDPTTGLTNYDNLLTIKKDLEAGKYKPTTELSLLKNGNVSTVSKTINNQPWTERGPYSVGGRTRAIMYDPNDATGKRVFAGGVSGGLWVNQDPSISTNEWTPVNDFWANTSISSITYDPNNPHVFYVGTGECETGDAIGSGIWKSSDSGATWTNIFTVAPTYTGSVRNGNYYINDIKVRNNAGVSEVYAGVSGAYVGISFVDGWNGLYQSGLYKSTDGGATWTKNSTLLATNTTTGTTSTIGYSIQQIEISSNNTIWVSTRSSKFSNIDSGGRIFKSTDGVTFTQVYNSATTGARVNIGVSKTNPSKVYGLLQGASSSTEPVRIIRTTDGGTTWSATNDASPVITLPTDADTGVPSNDFTRGQSFYDLVIVPDPLNDNNVYVGGIDIFKSADSGATWTQISKWSNNNNLAALTVALVHADQHAIVFNPFSNYSTNQMLFGNDGGIFYASNKNSFSSSTAIASRNTRYNVTQFYGGVLNPTATTAAEEFLCGAQDNGTSQLIGAPQANNFYPTVAYYGGDGMLTEFDNLASYKIFSYTNNYHYITAPNGSSYALIPSANQGNGHFVNEIALDRNREVFYSNNLTSGSATGISMNKVTGLLSNNVYTKTTLTPNTSVITAQTNEQIAIMKVSPYTTTSSSLFVGTNMGRIFKMTNADGASPTTTLLTSPATGNISAIEFGPNESSIIATLSNYNVTSIFYSTDGGTTWTSKEGNLPDMPVRTIFMNPDNNNEVIVGTEVGIWGTTNFLGATPTWSQYSNGIGNVRVTHLDYRTSTKTLLASTYGRGAWTSTNTTTLATNENIKDNRPAIVYPNPTRGNIGIKFDDAKYKNVKATIFDTSGRKVMTIDNVKSETNYPLSAKSGNYVLKLESNGQQFFSTIVLVLGNERD